MVVEASLDPRPGEPPAALAWPPPDTGSLRPGATLTHPALHGARAGDRDERDARWRGRAQPTYDSDGTLDASVVSAEIERRRGAIQAAYEHVLRRSPELAGRIDVQFKIDESGRLRDLVITRDTLKDGELNERVRSILSTWRFPTPLGGEQHYEYPFTFRPLTSLY
jgi:TonB family protein